MNHHGCLTRDSAVLPPTAEKKEALSRVKPGTTMKERGVRK